MKIRIYGTFQIVALAILLSFTSHPGTCSAFDDDIRQVLSNDFNNEFSENESKHRFIRNISLNDTLQQTSLSNSNRSSQLDINANNKTPIIINDNNSTKIRKSQINNSTNGNWQNTTLISSKATNGTTMPQINGAPLNGQNKTLIGSKVTTNGTIMPQINGTQFTGRNKTTKPILNINNGTLNATGKIDPQMKNNVTKQLDLGARCINCSQINMTNKERNPSSAFSPNVTSLGLNNRSKSMLRNITGAISGITQSINRNINRTEATGILRNISKANIPGLNGTIDPHFNPTRWLLKVQAPWKHVSERSTKNETDVTQVCKFESANAICSAEYTSSDVFEKLWIQIVESEGKNGITVVAFERGHVPRVVFKNRVNSTACQRFTNGTFHQICVKVYGYEKGPGPTRACLELGVALFNHGVASSDFGCFRFGSSVRHEEPLPGESPHPRILNKHILTNNYSNFINVTVPSAAGRMSTNAIVITTLLVLIAVIALIKQ